MKLLTTILLLGCGANHGTAFAPSMLISRRDLIKTYLSTTTAGAGVVTTVENKEDTKKNIKKVKHCIPLQNIGLDDLPKVGGKTASLGEMIQQLTPLGVSVPGGFGVSSTAYDGKRVFALIFLVSTMLQQQL